MALVAAEDLEISIFIQSLISTHSRLVDRRGVVCTQRDRCHPIGPRTARPHAPAAAMGGSGAGGPR